MICQHVRRQSVPEGGTLNFQLSKHTVKAVAEGSEGHALAMLLLDSCWIPSDQQTAHSTSLLPNVDVWYILHVPVCCCALIPAYGYMILLLLCVLTPVGGLDFAGLTGHIHISMTWVRRP